jgi:hypothetical protein
MWSLRIDLATFPQAAIGLELLLPTVNQRESAQRFTTRATRFESAGVPRRGVIMA